MRQEWQPFLSCKVPRYTSYPTANAFHDTLGPEDYCERLSKVEQYEPISLYVHVPFCKALCHYCGCNTSVCNDYSRAEDHIGFVVKEIATTGAILARRGRVTSVHFGGGTPNFLRVKDLQRILNAIEKHIGLTDQVEIAMEVDPRLVSYDNAKHLASLGVTRVSLGVQDFNADVQRAIGRVQPFASVAQVVAAFRSHGIFDINFDLLYGLPNQTPNTVAQTIEQAISLDPDRIAFFGYAHVPEKMAHQRVIDSATLPDISSRTEMMVLTSTLMTQAGYEQIGFDHFAKPADALAQSARARRLKRNFQGFTADPARTVIGFGVSAISQFKDLIVQNEKHLNAYHKAVDCGTLPTAQGVSISDEDRLRGDIIEQLLCFHEADIIGLCGAHSADLTVLADSLQDVKRLRSVGLTRYESGKIVIPEDARLLSRIVANCFDAHSKASLPASYAV